MLKGYAENEHFIDTIMLFADMRKRDVRVNEFTIPSVLKSCAKTSALPEGKEFHCFVAKSGFHENEFVGTSLIDMYTGGGDLESAYKVFVEMPTKNVVVSTAMVTGYIVGGHMESARSVFEQAPQRDVILFDTMISGYVGAGDLASARKLFDEMPTRDVMSWNTMLAGYANSGDFKSGEMLFEHMPERNIFSWNALIGGYSRNGCFSEVLGVFKRMLISCTVRPNDTTLVTVLSACARLGALDMGMWVHFYVENGGFKDNVYVNNGLIDMYAKCGSVDNALKVFNGMNSRDLISWNAIINGIAMHGCGKEALDIFYKMRAMGEMPDGITFVGVLCACAHMGLVEEGLTYFRLMVDEYMIVPQIEHYGCMVDLLGRAGFLFEAMEFVNKMPLEPDSVIWSSFLGACCVYKNVDLAKFALKQLMRLEPDNVANYVVLSNMYGALGRWKDMAKLKLASKETGTRKMPGCSLIEVNYTVSEFFSSDRRHCQMQEIYGILRGLTRMMKSVEYELEPQELKEAS